MCFLHVQLTYPTFNMIYENNEGYSGGDEKERKKRTEESADFERHYIRTTRSNELLAELLFAPVARQQLLSPRQ